MCRQKTAAAIGNARTEGGVLAATGERDQPLVGLVAQQ
jgi:hypothetical protein